MKRIGAFLLMLVMCVAMVCPVFAAEDDFVPSITYKGEPEIVEKVDENGDPILDKGQPVIGEVRELKTEKHISYVKDDCLLITPVAKVDTSEQIPEEAAEELKYVYEELVNGNMKLPYEKVEGIVAKDMVILELLDLTWLCGGLQADHDHPTEVEPEGVVFDVTFNLGVAADTKVVVMHYHNGEWEPIVRSVNNGDGTVTCVFEHLCPVAISVEQTDEVVSPETGDNANITLWVGVLGVALVGLIVLVVLSRRQTAKKSRSNR